MTQTITSINQKEVVFVTELFVIKSKGFTIRPTWIQFVIGYVAFDKLPHFSLSLSSLIWKWGQKLYLTPRDIGETQWDYICKVLSRMPGCIKGSVDGCNDHNREGEGSQWGYEWQALKNSPCALYVCSSEAGAWQLGPNLPSLHLSVRAHLALPNSESVMPCWAGGKMSLPEGEGSWTRSLSPLGQKGLTPTAWLTSRTDCEDQIKKRKKKKKK